MKELVDLTIIGTGISGISCALTLVNANYKGKIRLIDLGKNYEDRHCFIDSWEYCKNCNPCNTFAGFGGSVHYGDSAKLSCFPSGSRLLKLIGEANAKVFQDMALSLFDKTPNDFQIPEANLLSINYKTYPLSILDEIDTKVLIKKWYEILKASKNIEICFNTEVSVIKQTKDGFEISTTKKDEIFHSKKIVIAVGRQGFQWWKNEIRSLNISFNEPIISKGLRFICPNDLLYKASKLHPDFKTSIFYKSKKFKTFCFSIGDYGGRIKHSRYNGFMLIDGHGIFEEELSSNYSNFAILTQMKEDGKPLSFDWVQKNIITPFAQKNKTFPGKPLIQKYIDFKEKKVSNINVSSITEFNAINYFSADLSEFFNTIEHEGICFVFEQLINEFYSLTDKKISLDEIVSKVYVLGIEIEGLWDVIKIDSSMQSSIKDLYVIGDCAGIAQGILQSAISGCIAADSINAPT